jgi:hypothetical protein
VCKSLLRRVLLRSNLFPTAEFSNTAVNAQKKSYHRRFAERESCPVEIVSLPRISEGRSPIPTV